MSDTATGADSKLITTAEGPKKKGRRFKPARLAHRLETLGLGYFAPWVRFFAGDERNKQVKEIVTQTVLPLVALLVFLGAWELTSKYVVTDSTKIPSIGETFAAWESMQQFAAEEEAKETKYLADNETKVARYHRLADKAEQAGNAERAAELRGAAAKYANQEYVGTPTFGYQVWRSLVTVAIGFVIATLIAVPLGIYSGVSRMFHTAINPLVQIFKPVSPLAWFPIVFVFVTWGYEAESGEQFWTPALYMSAGVVCFCSLWPTLINTAVGVASIDQDHLNVAKVLKLGWFQRLVKIVLPSALPYIFTGLRLSIGVGWMVLIAADMMSQNVGLGKFVWDMYQNGDVDSTAKIIIAIFIIGCIGFLLDRIMLVFQRLVTFEEQTV